MRIKVLAPLFASLFLLAGCALTITPVETSQPPRQTVPDRTVAATPVTQTGQRVIPNYPHNQTIEYRCDGGRLLVRYTSNESAQVYDAGAWQTLTRTVNMDGHFVYRDDNYSWHARGKTGFLLHDDITVAANCSY